jgi:zinc protease
VLPDEVPLSRLYFGYRVPPYGSADWYAGDLLTHVLTGGKSSVLYRDLVYRRQIAQEVVAYLQPYESVCVLVVMATVRPGIQPEELEAAINDHLAELAVAPPPAAEVEAARARIMTGFYSALQRIDHCADLLSQFTTLFNRPEGVAEEAGRYLTIAPAELQRFAATYLRADRRVLVTVAPKS